MSIVVDVGSLSNINQDEDIQERLKKAAEDGDIDRLYDLIAEDPNVLGHSDNVPFYETPLHVAAEKGKTHFAMEVMSLKPSLALKLNPSGFSPIHLALKNHHNRLVRGFIAIDNSLVSIRGRGRITPLHHVARRGEKELLSEFLLAYPSSVEDLTTKRETVVHIAVKNNHVDAVKVLVGWLKREGRKEILDWKDEDGNTVYHIAASINQAEVMELLRNTVKLGAKNLDGKTAMDILQIHQSPHSLRANLFVSEPMITLAEYLSQKPSFIERRNTLLGLNNLNNTKHGSLNYSDSRSVILVVAILIITASYQAGLSPPGGYWQENSPNYNASEGQHLAGDMTMSFPAAIYYYWLIGLAFVTSLFVILILIVGLPFWKILYISTATLALANALTCTLSPQNDDESIALGLCYICFVLLVFYIVNQPFTAFRIDTRRRCRVDFPAKYFQCHKRIFIPRTLQRFLEHVPLGWETLVRILLFVILFYLFLVVT